MLMMVLTFAFLYVFVPNARVNLFSALIGALVAAVLWQAVGWVFAHFMVRSTQYTAVYSSLAILILFMIWIYIAWLIVLIGASVTFYHQHPEYLSSRSRDLKLSNRLRERLALLVAGQVARNHLLGVPAWTGEGLAAAMGVPKTNIRRTLRLLEQEGFLLRTADDPPRFAPSAAPESQRVKSVLDAARCFEERESGCRGSAPDPGIQEVETKIDDAIGQALGDMTLRDLAKAMGNPHRAVREVKALAGPAGEDEESLVSREPSV